MAPCSRILSLYIVLRGAWKEIVGDELIDLTSFNNAKYVGKDELIITINVLNSAVLLVKCNSESIVNNLRRLTRAHSVKIIFYHKHFILREIVDTDCQMRPVIRRQRSVIEAKFDNTLLKAALEALKTEMQYAA
ncbi:MAG: hypothetical protein LBB34_00835 [Holosporales bacterium]|nr:hypothetical protein [Holosporales bacterium]